MGAPFVPRILRESSFFKESFFYNSPLSPDIHTHFFFLFSSSSKKKPRFLRFFPSFSSPPLNAPPKRLALSVALGRWEPFGSETKKRQGETKEAAKLQSFLTSSPIDVNRGLHPRWPPWPSRPRLRVFRAPVKVCPLSIVLRLWKGLGVKSRLGPLRNAQKRGEQVFKTTRRGRQGVARVCSVQALFALLAVNGTRPFFPLARSPSCGARGSCRPPRERATRRFESLGGA